MTITSIAQLRKLIKPLGYNVKVKTESFGKFATYHRGDDECPSIFTADTLLTWQPLFELLRSVAFELDEKIYGLTK